MSEYLSAGAFLEIKNYNFESILRRKDDSGTGYFSECDLKYPSKIHNSTSLLKKC